MIAKRPGDEEYAKLMRQDGCRKYLTYDEYKNGQVAGEAQICTERTKDLNGTNVKVY